MRQPALFDHRLEVLQSADVGERIAVKRCANSPTMASLGMVFLRLGRVDEALARYDQAIAKRVGAPAFMGRALGNVVGEY